MVVKFTICDYGSYFTGSNFILILGSCFRFDFIVEFMTRL